MSEQRMLHPVCSLIPDATRGLEQSSPFGPFVGKFVMLGQIAMGATSYQVGDIIRTSARKRDNVIYVIGVLSVFLGKFGRAIITAIFLPFQLLLNLLLGMSTLRVFDTGNAIKAMNALSYLDLWSLVITFVIGFHLLLILWKGATNLTIRDFMFFPLCAIPPISFAVYLLFMMTPVVYSVVVILAGTRCNSLFMRIGRIPIGCGSFSVAYPTRVRKTVSSCVASSKKLFCSSKSTVALATLFLWRKVCSYFYMFTVLFDAYVFARLTLTFYSIFAVLITMEKFGRCRESFFAFGTLLLRSVLGYSIHADEIHLSFVTPGDGCNVALAKQYLPLNYTINQPLKQVQGVGL